MEQLTLMEAYLIEVLRSNGITEEEIIEAVENKQVDKFKEVNENFDFNGLYNIGDQLPEILASGYQVKFLTLPGLVNLLRMKHNKEEGKDFVKEKTSITNLSLTQEEQEAINQWLSVNWTLKEADETYEIVPSFQ